MRRTLFGLFVVALVVADAGLSSASVRKIDGCTADGSFVCAVSGSVRHPRRLFIEARSRPRHWYQLDWTTVCFKWSGHERLSGSVLGQRTPFDKRIPMAYWRPDRCRVEVSVFGGFGCCGHTKLVLRARV